MDDDNLFGLRRLEKIREERGKNIFSVTYRKKASKYAIEDENEKDENREDDNDDIDDTFTSLVKKEVKSSTRFNIDSDSEVDEKTKLTPQKEKSIDTDSDSEVKKKSAKAKPIPKKENKSQ